MYKIDEKIPYYFLFRDLKVINVLDQLEPIEYDLEERVHWNLKIEITWLKVEGYYLDGTPVPKYV